MADAAPGGDPTVTAPPRRTTAAVRSTPPPGARAYDESKVGPGAVADNETSARHSVGYPQNGSGNGELAAWQTNFFLNELGTDRGSARLIRSKTFDNWPGQSGSPIFGFWVVGVVSGEGDDCHDIADDSLLPSLVRRARNENP